MDLKTYWYGLLAGAPWLNATLTRAQTADHALQTDQLPSGICSGLAVAQAATPAMSVVVAGPGVAYDASGQRCYVPSNQTISMTTDSSGNPIATPTTGGNTKIVSVALKFARNNQTPFIDLNSVGGFEDNYESFSIVTVAGAEGNPGAAPALDPTTVLLADVTLTHSMTTVLNANIDQSTRRQAAWNVTGGTYATPVTLTATTAYGAVQQLLSALNGVITGAANNIAGTAITYGGSGTWVNSLAGLAAGSISSALTAAVAALASTTLSLSGADRVGSAAFTVGTITTVAGSVWQQLSALANATGIYKASGGTWANADTTTAGTLAAYLDTSVIAALAASTGNGGTARVGGVAIPTLTTGAAIGAGTLNSQLVALKANANLDAPALTGTGFNLAAGSVKSQLQSVANQGAALASPTFTGTVTLPGAPALTGSPSVTRAQRSSVMLSVSVANGASVSDFFFIPHGATLTSVNIYVSPGAHGAWPPAVLSHFMLYAYNSATGGSSSLGTGTDTAANLTAGNAVRAITLNGLSHTIDRTTTVYLVQYTNESGANAQASSILGLMLTFNVASIDIGG